MAKREYLDKSGLVQVLVKVGSRLDGIEGMPAFEFAGLGEGATAAETVVAPQRVVWDESSERFYADTGGGVYFERWPGFERWIDPESGEPWKDRLYRGRDGRIWGAYMVSNSGLPQLLLTEESLKKKGYATTPKLRSEWAAYSVAENKAYGRAVGEVHLQLGGDPEDSDEAKAESYKLFMGIKHEGFPPAILVPDADSGYNLTGIPFYMSSLSMSPDSRQIFAAYEGPKAPEYSDPPLFLITLERDHGFATLECFTAAENRGADAGGETSASSGDMVLHSLALDLDSGGFVVHSQLEDEYRSDGAISLSLHDSEIAQRLDAGGLFPDRLLVRCKVSFAPAMMIYLPFRFADMSLEDAFGGHLAAKYRLPDETGSMEGASFVLMRNSDDQQYYLKGFGTEPSFAEFDVDSEDLYT